MAESTPAQPPSPGAPGSIREGFMSRLAAERGEAPSEEAQPPADEDLIEDETSEAQADALEADDADEGETTAPSEEEAQPEDTAEAEITVDGKTYDVATIQEMESRFHELDSKTKRTWRDQANEAAHRRREFESSSELIETQDHLYSNLARGNVDRLARVDVSTLQTPEQFQAYQADRQRSENGFQQLQAIQADMKTKRDEHSERLRDEEATASVEVLMASEPRWDSENKFYGEVRAFAVDNGIYTAEEFADITDWRKMAGLIAMRDVELAQSPGEVVTRETKKPSARKQRQKRQRRSAKGQFQSLQQQVQASPNAKKDGSFRAMKLAQLAAERE